MGYDRQQRASSRLALHSQTCFSKVLSLSMPRHLEGIWHPPHNPVPLFQRRRFLHSSARLLALLVEQYKHVLVLTRVIKSTSMAIKQLMTIVPVVLVCLLSSASAFVTSLAPVATGFRSPASVSSRTTSGSCYLTCCVCMLRHE